MAASLFRRSGKNRNPGLFYAETGLSGKILGRFTGGVKDSLGEEAPAR
jgi:hypothetical protein